MWAIFRKTGIGASDFCIWCAQVASATRYGKGRSDSVRPFPQKSVALGVEFSSGFLVGVLPSAGISQEFLYFIKGFDAECPLKAGLFQDVPPCAQVVKCDAMIAQRLGGFGEDVVIEDHGCVAAGLATSSCGRGWIQ